MVFSRVHVNSSMKEISKLLSCSSSHCLSNMLLLGYLCFKIHYREYCITVMKGLPGHLSTYLRHVTRFAAFEADCSHLIKTSTGPAHISLYQHCTISNGVIPWITRYQRQVDQRDQSRWDSSRCTGIQPFIHPCILCFS